MKFSLEFEGEEQYKEKIYTILDEEYDKAEADLNYKKKKVDEDAYEEQYSHIAHSEFHEAERRRNEICSRILALYKCPYYSHIELSDSGLDSHYFLSDCPELEQPIRKNGLYLIPFKKGALYSVLSQIYRSKKGGHYEYRTEDGAVVDCVVQLLCDDDIANRVLRKVIQYYPAPKEKSIDLDELMEMRLSENRDNPSFKNIIATLATKQFEIMEIDPSQNFVLQGCAGSGKSQCLINRLFYLRDHLSSSQWNNVLMITPSKLFKNYESDQIRKFKLTEVESCSVSELYKQLLEAFDQRFSDRQYIFELTEENLPEDYLKNVYSEKNILMIATEINRAFKKYTGDACEAIGVKLPKTISATFINELSRKIDEELSRKDVEDRLEQDNEYAKKKTDYETLIKKIEKAEKDIDLNRKKLQDIDRNAARVKDQTREKAEAEKEYKSIIKQYKSAVKATFEQLKEVKEASFAAVTAEFPYYYSRKLSEINDFLSGVKYKFYQHECDFYLGYSNYMESQIKELTGGLGIKEYNDSIKKKKVAILSKISELEDSISISNKQKQELELQLLKRIEETEGVGYGKVFNRYSIERSKRLLSRLESDIFEKEVWNALAPLKEKFSIKTLETTVLPDGRKKESRILYKSDLLFYLMIYSALHSLEKLPGYSLICIDEGQDLHKADYQMVRALFPKAVLNVFGDINQILHESYGVYDWEDDTGIKEIYPLDVNYRNPPEIVKFCNDRFEMQMKYVGKMDPNRCPKIINSAAQLRKEQSPHDIDYIILDNIEFRKMCSWLGLDQSECQFIDTRSEEIQPGKIHCYTVYAAKGLEFSNVFVYSDRMTEKQKFVSCTRATKNLYYYEKDPVNHE